MVDRLFPPFFFFLLLLVVITFDGLSFFSCFLILFAPLFCFLLLFIIIYLFLIYYFNFTYSRFNDSFFVSVVERERKRKRWQLKKEEEDRKIRLIVCILFKADAQRNQESVPSDTTKRLKSLRSPAIIGAMVCAETA